MLDAVPVAQISHFLDRACERLEESEPDVLQALQNASEISEATHQRLQQCIEAAYKSFQQSTPG